jgi:hypothetical protein
MTRAQLRTIVGLSVIVIHALCFWILREWKTDWLSPAERQDISLLLIPITATYFVAIVRSAIEHRSPIKDKKKLSFFYVAVVCVVTFLFLSALLSLVMSVPGPKAPTVDDIRRDILLLEIAFGGGFGLIATDLFGKVEAVEVGKAGRRRVSNS